MHHRFLFQQTVYSWLRLNWIKIYDELLQIRLFHVTVLHTHTFQTRTPFILSHTFVFIKCFWGFTTVFFSFWIIFCLYHITIPYGLLSLCMFRFIGCFTLKWEIQMVFLWAGTLNWISYWVTVTFYVCIHFCCCCSIFVFTIRFCFIAKATKFEEKIVSSSSEFSFAIFAHFQFVLLMYMCKHSLFLCTLSIIIINIII